MPKRILLFALTLASNIAFSQKILTNYSANHNRSIKQYDSMWFKEGQYKEDWEKWKTVEVPESLPGSASLQSGTNNWLQLNKYYCVLSFDGYGASGHTIIFLLRREKKSIVVDHAFGMYSNQLPANFFPHLKSKSRNDIDLYRREHGREFKDRSVFGDEIYKDYINSYPEEIEDFGTYWGTIPNELAIEILKRGHYQIFQEYDPDEYIYTRDRLKREFSDTTIFIDENFASTKFQQSWRDLISLPFDNLSPALGANFNFDYNFTSPQLPLYEKYDELITKDFKVPQPLFFKLSLKPEKEKLEVIKFHGELYDDDEYSNEISLSDAEIYQKIYCNKRVPLFEFETSHNTFPWYDYYEGHLKGKKPHGFGSFISKYEDFNKKRWPVTKITRYFQNGLPADGPFSISSAFIKFEGFLKDGKIHGPAKFYNKNGTVRSYVYFEDGKIAESKPFIYYEYYARFKDINVDSKAPEFSPRYKIPKVVFEGTANNYKLSGSYNFIPFYQETENYKVTFQGEQYVFYQKDNTARYEIPVSFSYNSMSYVPTGSTTAYYDDGGRLYSNYDPTYLISGPSKYRFPDGKTVDTNVSNGYFKATYYKHHRYRFPKDIFRLDILANRIVEDLSYLGDAFAEDFCESIGKEAGKDCHIGGAGLGYNSDSDFALLDETGAPAILPFPQPDNWESKLALERNEELEDYLNEIDIQFPNDDEITNWRNSYFESEYVPLSSFTLVGENANEIVKDQVGEVKEKPAKNISIQKKVVTNNAKEKILTYRGGSFYEPLGFYRTMSFGSPTSSGKIRPSGSDGPCINGCGDFGATRIRTDPKTKEKGTFLHPGTDFLAEPGEPIYAPITGSIVEIRYSDKSQQYQADNRLTIVIKDEGGYTSKTLYVVPTDELYQKVFVGKKTMKITQGQQIGVAANIVWSGVQKKYQDPIQNHVHQEFLDPQGKFMSVDGLLQLNGYYDKQVH